MFKKSRFAIIALVAALSMAEFGSFPVRGNSYAYAVENGSYEARHGITEYKYPEKFTLSGNLRCAIAELAVCYGDYSSETVKKSDWKETFIDHFIKNSYKKVCKDANSEAGICEVYRSASITGGKAKKNIGIVYYNTKKKMIFAIELNNKYTNKSAMKMAKKIAKSITMK